MLNRPTFGGHINSTTESFIYPVTNIIIRAESRKGLQRAGGVPRSDAKKGANTGPLTGELLLLATPSARLTSSNSPRHAHSTTGRSWSKLQTSPSHYGHRSLHKPNARTLFWQKSLRNTPCPSSGPFVMPGSDTLVMPGPDRASLPSVCVLGLFCTREVFLSAPVCVLGCFRTRDPRLTPSSRALTRDLL